MSAIGLFVISSMACGISPNFASFIAARVVQGSAAAMMSPVGRLVVLRSAEKNELMQALSALVWPGLIAPVLGPPLGGFITQAANWRWIFYVNLPIGLLGIALVAAFIPNDRASETKPFDISGFLLMALALACLTYGIDLVGARQGDAAGGLWLGLGLVATGGLVGWAAVRHARRAAHPLISLGPFASRTFFISSISGGLLTRASIHATPFLLPLMFQIGYGLSPLDSGLLLLIYMGANLGMKTVTNPILRRFGFRNVLIWNGAIAAASVAACALIVPSGPALVTGGILIVAGASRSMQFTANSMVTFAEVAPEHKSSASVLFSLTQQVGMSMGVAVGALMLSASQAVRGAASLSLFDFRFALVLTGALCFLTLWPWSRLPAGAGAEMSGQKAS
jgi:MFS family permease